MSIDSLEFRSLLDGLDAANRQACLVADGLSEAQGTWRERPTSWSVSECLDHLAMANRVYLAAMRGAADRARQQGRTRRRPALPGLIGRWFAWSLEPPARMKTRTAAVSTPRPSPPLSDALAAFLASQEEVRAFVRAYADLDLAGVTFPNPFVRGIRFSLATGLHVITAHERRHLWQAGNVRRAMAAGDR